jgi:hypothetical protein
MARMKTALLAGVAIIGMVIITAPANAALLSDNFDSSTATGNWPGDLVFQSFPLPGNVTGSPSVDLVGPGFFPELAMPSNGNSVDLDGSTGSGHSPAGELKSFLSFVLGNYIVQFDLAGNLRGATAQTTTVCIGGSCQSLSPANNQPYTLEMLSFTGVSGNLTFTDPGPSDQIGNLLDNVVVNAAPGPIPGAGLLSYIALGLFGFGSMGWKRLRQQGA